MIYPNLSKIFDIEEKQFSQDSFDFSGYSLTQKIYRMQELTNLAVKDRLEYLNNIQLENKRFRYKILTTISEHSQNLLKEKCKRDILFYINCFVWTYNPRLSNPNLPFITYPFQDKAILDIVDSIEVGVDHWFEKSRDMGFSWMMLAILSWGFLFKGWASLIGSYKQDYVDQQGNMDSAFERLRYIFDRLPNWLKPDDMIIKFMSIGSKRLGSEISGDAGASFGTGGRRKVVFLDEFALRQFDDTALRKTKDLTRCRIFGGTPEGTSNVYGKVMTGHKDYSHLVVKKTKLHWKEHPLKTNVWYELEKMTRTSLDLAKEVDISYTSSVSGAVYPLFSRQVQIGKYVYDSSRFTYTGQDFGLDTNACVVIQKDFKTNDLYVIKSFKRVNWSIQKFGGLVIGRPTQGEQYDEEDYKIMDLTRHYKYSNHFGDPYNTDSRTTVNIHSTIRSEYSKLGIHLYTNRAKGLQDRIKDGYLSFNRLYIDQSCVDFYESMVQSRYPQIKEGSERTSEQTKPIHDEHSHYRTAYEYFISNEPEHDQRFIESVSQDYGDLY